MAMIEISDELRDMLKDDIKRLKKDFGNSRLTYTFIIDYWRNKAQGVEGYAGTKRRAKS